MDATSWSAVAKLEAKYTSGTSEGTAFLVDPEHLITAGHCVRDRGNGASPLSVNVRFMLDGRNLGQPLPVSVHVTHHAADVALLRLGTRVSYKPLVLHPMAFRAASTGSCTFKGFGKDQQVLMPVNEQTPYEVRPGYGIDDALQIKSPLGDGDLSGFSGSPVLVDGKVYAVLRVQHVGPDGTPFNHLAAAPLHHLSHDVMELLGMGRFASSSAEITEANRMWEKYAEFINTLHTSAPRQVQAHAQSIAAILERYDRKYQSDGALLIDLGDHNRYPKPYYDAMQQGMAVIAVSNLEKLKLSEFLRVGDDPVKQAPRQRRFERPIIRYGREAVGRGARVHRIFYVHSIDAPGNAVREAEAHARAGILTYLVAYESVDGQDSLKDDDFAVFDSHAAAKLIRSDNQAYAGLLIRPRVAYDWLHDLRTLVNNDEVTPMGFVETGDGRREYGHHGDTKSLLDDLGRLEGYYKGLS